MQCSFMFHGVLLFLQLYLRLFYPKPSYEVATQYYVYSSDSLIADIGGYLVTMHKHSIVVKYFTSYLKAHLHWRTSAGGPADIRQRTIMTRGKYHLVRP